MLKYELQSKKPYTGDEPYSLVNTDNDDDDEDEEDYKPPPNKKKRRSRLITHSSSPEPSKPTTTLPPQQPQPKGRKKAKHNPNRTDKAGRTKLFSATTAGHLDKVIELIESGADVNFKDNAGWTPLHEAALKGQFEIGKYLIRCGAEVNVRGFGLDTPLHDACNSNSPECVKLLVDAGADVFALNEAEKRPIDLCSDEACQDILEAKMKQLDQLIARDKQGRSSLHRACIDNKPNRVLALIEQGADVNAKDNQDATPLHFACALGHLDIVKLLIEQGAIVNILGSKHDNTPLHEASRHGHRDTVRFLIESAGADVNMKDKAGDSPYHVSAAFPPIRQILTARMDEVRLEQETCNALDEIAKKTALRNEPERQLTREEKKIQNYMRMFNNDNKTSKTNPLDEYTGPVASIKRRKKSMPRRKSMSVESDASNGTNSRKSPTTGSRLDIRKKDTSGRTHLHKFSKRGDAESVENLLEAGANPNEKDFAGWTPLHEAALNGHLNVVKLLLKYGANVNSKGADSDTPLHDATGNNHCDIVELLLEHGADPFARNAHDAEPIDIATENDFSDIVLVLQAANPVVKKKRQVKKETDAEDKKKPMVDVHTNTTKETVKQTKKRRLIQAADLEKNNSNRSCDEEQEESKYALRHPRSPRAVRSDFIVKTEPVEEVLVERNKRKDTSLKLEKEDLAKSPPLLPTPSTVVHRYIPSKKNLYVTAKNTYISSNDLPHYTQQQLHSPIHTPPPDNWIAKEKDVLALYSPLYTVQIQSQHATDKKYYVIDLQISLFLDMTLDDFWTEYPFLSTKRKTINAEGKSRLWNTLKNMIHEEKTFFVARSLYFIPLDDVLELIKRDFNHLSSNLITITLDIGYHDQEQSQHQSQQQQQQKLYSLPPKIAMKMKKCGYQFRPS